MAGCHQPFANAKTASFQSPVNQDIVRMRRRDPASRSNDRLRCDRHVPGIGKMIVALPNHNLR